MIAEYAHIAGAPSATDPWPLVLAIALRAERFEARRQLTTLDGVATAVAGAFGGKIEGVRRQLQATAYPRPGKQPLVFPPNLAAEGPDAE